jgi:hypothetical protein
MFAVNCPNMIHTAYHFFVQTAVEQLDAGSLSGSEIRVIFVQD